MRILVVLLFASIISFIMPDDFKPLEPGSADQSQKPLFSFGLIADVQYCDCESVGTRYYRSSLSKLAEALYSFRTDSPKFVINLGDLIEKDYASYNAVYKIIDTARLKIYHVIGNHDYSVETRLKKRVPQLQLNKGGYYSFNHDNFRFIVLNGNEISTYAAGSKSAIKQADDLIIKLKSENEPNAVDWNGGMSSKQMGWLTDQLNTATQNNEKVFIMCHFPVWPVDTYNLLNYKEVLPILGKYDNIIVWFAGHNHQGNYANFNMIHFVTMKGMVETTESNSFALVEVYSNKIWIHGYGRQKSQILAY